MTTAAASSEGWAAHRDDSLAGKCIVSHIVARTLVILSSPGRFRAGKTSVCGFTSQGQALTISPVRPVRLLPDGTVLRNRLLRALSVDEYARVERQLEMRTTIVGRTLHAQGSPITRVYFPNGGVFSVTTQMRNGATVEVATVGIEGMLGIGAFLGDRMSGGQTLLQVPDGRLPGLSVAQFTAATAVAGTFRQVVARYAHANLLQVMQGVACNALHDVRQRCCRWLLQTSDRVGAAEFLLKQEFLAMMLGVQRPTVTHVIGALQRTGALSSRYGRIRILDRPELQRASCECYAVIRGHFRRLRL